MYTKNTIQIQPTIEDKSSLIFQLDLSKIQSILNYLWQQTCQCTYIICIFGYVLIFLVGIIGNSTVIYVVWGSSRMRTSTNILIANLAGADLLVIVFCLPFQMYNSLFKAWKFGNFFCKVVPYLQGVSVDASINILIAISIERCLAICYPMKSHKRNRIPKYVIIIIWIFPFFLPMPWLFFFNVQRHDNESDIEVCVESWPNVHYGNLYFIAANVILCYILPLIVISFCFYCIWKRVSCRVLPGESSVRGNALINRSKIKVTKMMLIVIIVFACSWLPLYTIFTVVKFWNSSEFLDPYIPFAQWLGVANSCFNPVLYAFYNKNFRNAFKALYSGKSCCRPVPNVNGSSNSSRTRTDVTISGERKLVRTIATVRSERWMQRSTSQMPMRTHAPLKADLLRGYSVDHI